MAEFVAKPGDFTAAPGPDCIPICPCGGLTAITEPMPYGMAARCADCDRVVTVMAVDWSVLPRRIACGAAGPRRRDTDGQLVPTEAGRLMHLQTGDPHRWPHA